MNIHEAQPMSEQEAAEFERAVNVQNAAFARLMANKMNAQKSTGPCTPEGRAIASKNAVKTGLTGRTVLLPTDDAERYEKHVERFRRDFNPVTEREMELVQSLADTQWRLNRIPRLEMGIYVRGCALYEVLFLEIQDREMRALAVESHTHAVHAREFNNLSIQESRLRRNYAKDLAELKSLQAEREKSPIGAMSEAIGAPAPNGFVFSTTASGADFQSPAASHQNPAREHGQGSWEISHTGPIGTSETEPEA